MAPAKKAVKKTAKAAVRKAGARASKAPKTTAPAPSPATGGWEEQPVDFASPPPAPRPAPAPAAPVAPAGWSAVPVARMPMRPDEERQYALFLHLSALSGFLTGGLGFIAGPLIMWLIKKDESAFVDRHGRAAVDFWISMLIYIIGAFVLVMVVAVVTLGIGVLLLLPLMFIGGAALFVLALLLPILAGLKAQRGEEHRYPLSFRFLASPPPQPPPGTTLI